MLNCLGLVDPDPAHAGVAHASAEQVRVAAAVPTPAAWSGEVCSILS